MNTSFTLTDGMMDDVVAQIRRDKAQNAQRVLHAVWLYDEDEESRKLVDGSGEYGVYGADVMRKQDDALPCYGEDYARAVAPHMAEEPMSLVEGVLAGMPEERRKVYEEEFNRLQASGKDTKRDYYGLYGKLVRDEVRGRHEVHKQRVAEVQASVARMPEYVRGDEFAEQDLANVRTVMEPRALDDARAVRNWMQTYVKPLSEKTDAEEMMRTLDGLEDEFFEVIGQDAQRAEMAYMAMMHWAEGVKQSNKVGVADELIVAVGKKLSNWADPRTGAIFATQGAIGPAGAINPGALQSASSQIQSAYKDSEERRAARSILRAAINKGMELGDDVNWWVGTARTAAQMTGDTLPYLLPYVGPAVGTMDVFSTGLTETADQLQLAGLSGAQAGGQAVIETGVQAAVELLPFGKVGGRGLSALTRRVFGEAVENGRAGKFARWVVRNTQKSTMRALVAEGAASFVDEAVLEPVAAGLMTYGAEQTFDVLGVPHGQSRAFADCFDELKQLFKDPHQAAGLLLFTAGLTGAGAYGVSQNVKYFARHRRMWEAEGLTPEQVDKVMAADDKVAVGSKLVQEGWNTDPAGMRERMLAVCGEMAERGEVIVLTGEGALDAELENSELAPAYKAVWNEYVERGLLPKVEAVEEGRFRITKAGADGKPVLDVTLDAAGADAYLQHAIDEVDRTETLRLQERVGKGYNVDLRSEIGNAVSQVAGNAAMRQVAERGESKGVDVVDLTAGLPEWLAAPIRGRGQVLLKDAQSITEWAIGRINALMGEGMSEADARMSRPEAEGMARTFGEWASFARDFANRERLEGLEPGEGAITIGRTRGKRAVEFDGREVLGQTILAVPGQVRYQGAVEDVTESFLDMMVQERAGVLLDGRENATPGERAEAEEQAWRELADVARRAREVVLKAEPKAAVNEVSDGDRMSVIEALSTLATSRFIASAVVPKWMQSLTRALKGNLEAADALEKVRAAYAGVLEREPGALGDVEAVLERLGVHVQDVFRDARVEAVDVQAWRAACAVVGARADGLSGSGGAPVSAVVQAAAAAEDDIVRAERAADEDVGGGASQAEVAAEAAEVLNDMVPGSNAPDKMRGVFVDDKCYYNAAGGFWCGMIDKSLLRDGTEQVKVGAKGKHGVIQGRELTGRFQQNVGAIYVWRRTNGELQVISGRHRFAKLMEDDGAQYCNAYVFEEDAEHDEKWARMLDYENNMRDDQADEVTAATYVRETGLSDAELKERGLMRNGTRCKRGALIGRYARAELWTRFVNGAVKPMDAEVICNLTRSIRKQERVDEIQARCCVLLDAKKSWEYIGAMVQLMANKENVVMKQGLLNFGADFEADLARAAEWIERSITAINESITLLKQGRKLSGKKREQAERLGITTATQEGADEMLRDLEQLKAQFELIGSYPDLIAQAQMWDGKTEVDPVGRYLEQARAEREQAAAEGEMSADEYLAEQARREAAEAVPSLFSMQMEEKKRVVENNEPTEDPVTFSMRTKAEPKKKGIGYKVFYQKDGKLYPPMVANPGGADTPVGVWLDADEGVRAGESKTGRPQVKAGGKGTQGGSGTLAYRPGWHLGKIPYALQFNRKNPVTGERDLFPKDFVWAEVEYAADVDYQEEAMSYGVNKNGKFQHSLAGLPRIPEDGYYEYRTNPNPQTDPWIITGAMKVMRVLTRAEVDELVRAAGREPQKVEGDVVQEMSFNVVGRSAKNWDKIKHRAFKGRDDGKLRVEIDASQAKLKWQDLRGKNAKAYHAIIADWNNMPEDDRKAVEAYAELWDESNEAAKVLNNVGADGFEAAYAEAKRLADKVKAERVKVREIIERFLKMKGADGAAAITVKNDIIDAMAVDFWCMWPSNKVYNELASDPLRFGMELRDVLEYPELFEAYPQLEEVRVYTEDLKGYHGLAGYNNWGSYIMMNASLLDDWERFFSTLLHEVQHVIQRIEGFAKGGNKESVLDKVKDVLANSESHLEMLKRDLRWFSGVQIARGYMKEAQRIMKYPNAWKRSGLRFKVSRFTNDAEEIRGAILRELAAEYEAFRRDDASENLLLDRPEFMLPEVDFRTLSGIDAGLAALEGQKSRKLAFRGMSARKNRRFAGLIKRHEAMKKVLDEFKYEPFELYMRLAGEIEARNVQARMGWSAEEREATPFNNTLEYPGEALVTFDMQRKRDLTLAGEHVTQSQAWAHLSELEGKPLQNARSMFVAVVNKPQRKELTNMSKARKSAANGFSIDAHYAAVCRIDKLFEYAIPCGEYPDLKHADSNVRIHRFACPLMIGEEKAVAWLTAKQTIKVEGSERLYNLELVDIERLAGNLENIESENLSTLSPAASKDILAQIEEAFKTYFEEVPGYGNFSGSMERASLRALDVLMGRSDERAGEVLIKDWQRACDAWSQLAAADDGRLGGGAKLLGEMQALIGATKGVLPEKYCRMGHLNGLMRWAGIYAQMQQAGDVPKAGVLKGAIYERFVVRMQKGDELNRLQGMSDAEAKEAIALLAGEKLDVAMMKVANECRRRLEMFLKDRERERIDWVVEHAYPKRAAGQKWPRGKMDAESYRRMERAYELMDMAVNDVAELIAEAKRKLEELDPADAEYERKEEELEEEISLASVFGGWAEMGFEQARRACGVMVEMVLMGRAAWKDKLRAERRRANYDRAVISRNFKVRMEDMQKVRAQSDAAEKGRKSTIAKKIAMGSMSYSQLMLALEPKLGKEFTGRQMRMIARAHEQLQAGTQEMHRWMLRTLKEITGLKSEGDIEVWMNENNQIIDTGIVLTPRVTETCRMTPDEVEMWLAMPMEEREERRKAAKADADAKGEVPDNVPSEPMLEEMRNKLLASREAETSPKEYVVTMERRYESPLHCTREAMLYAILTFEQDDYKRLMDVNGVNEGTLERMRELVGEKLLAWGYAMREKLNENGMTMADVYEAHTGVPFAKRVKYFRGVFDNAKLKDKGEAVDAASSITGGKYGCLVPRQYHNQMLNWGTSATAVFCGSLKEQQNYICTSHITREWRTLLSNQGFEKRMRAEVGDAAMDLINGWCKMIDGAVLADAKVNALMNRLLGRVIGAYAVSRLAGNMYTIVKQVSAVLNGFVGGYVPEKVVAGDAVAQQLVYRHIGFGEYLQALGKAMAGQTEISLKEIEESKAIAVRQRVEGSHLEDVVRLAPGQKVPGKAGRAARAVYEANMDVIGWVDRKCNARAALAVAEAVYQQGKRENKDGLVPDAELRRVAIETAGMMIDRAAQPQLRTQKGYWAAGGGAFGAMGNFFYLFKSEVLGKLGLYVAQMFAGQHGAWLAGALSFGVLNSVVLALIDYVRGYWYDDDKDKWEKRVKSFVWNVVANDISSVPVLGDAEGLMRELVLGERPWSNNSLLDIGVPVRDMYKYARREVKYVSDGADWDQHVTALCGLARALGAAGGWFQNGSRVAVGSCAEMVLAAASISNLVRFGKDSIELLRRELD